mmetsp:Transcript_6162/g.23771  ORF Transcript_6162/g.23771 Transcript_6162/m.23771 type:complete len:306 (+) Transcript_6162:2924-3841(+)
MAATHRCVVVVDEGSRRFVKTWSIVWMVFKQRIASSLQGLEQPLSKLVSDDAWLKPKSSSGIANFGILILRFLHPRVERRDGFFVDPMKRECLRIFIFQRELGIPVADVAATLKQERQVNLRKHANFPRRNFCNLVGVNFQEGVVDKFPRSVRVSSHGLLQEPAHQLTSSRMSVWFLFQKPYPIPMGLTDELPIPICFLLMTRANNQHFADAKNVFLVDVEGLFELQARCERSVKLTRRVLALTDKITQIVCEIIPVAFIQDEPAHRLEVHAADPLNMFRAKGSKLGLSDVMVPRVVGHEGIQVP